MASEPLSDVLDELTTWCNFIISNDEHGPPIARQTLHSTQILHRTDPKALVDIKDRYVGVCLGFADEVDPAASSPLEDQTLFLEEVRQAYKAATASQMEIRSLSSCQPFLAIVTLIPLQSTASLPLGLPDCLRSFLALSLVLNLFQPRPHNDLSTRCCHPNQLHRDPGKR